MTDTYELPELPRECSTVAILTGIDTGNDAPVFTADQMRAYGQECAKLERERCAKVAESFATCPCNGERGRCMENDPPRAVADAIRQGDKP